MIFFGAGLLEGDLQLVAINRSNAPIAELLVKDAVSGRVALRIRSSGERNRRRVDDGRLPPAAVGRVLRHQSTRAPHPAVAAIEPAGRGLDAASIGKDHMVRPELVDEARGNCAHPLPVPVPVRREEDM